MLAESLPGAPAVLSVDLLRPGNALLPFALRRIHNFGTMLEPRYIVGTGPLDQ